MLKYEDYQGNKGTVATWTHPANTLTYFTNITYTNISNMKVWVEISGDSAGSGKGFSVTLDFLATGSECAEV
jgi:hypothetical protein